MADEPRPRPARGRPAPPEGAASARPRGGDRGADRVPSARLRAEQRAQARARTEARAQADDRARAARLGPDGDAGDGGGPRGRWVAAAMSLGRGALVALPIAAGFVILAVFPLRTWLDQQDAISDTRDRLARLQDENDRLEADAARLQSPTEIERRARAQFNLVYPGEEAIAIIAPEPTTPPSDAGPSTTTTAAATGP